MSVLTLDLTFEYADEKTAETILSAVSPENGGYVDARIEGCKVVYRMEADNAGTLRNTADDLLACIKAAEETVGIISGHHEVDE